MHQLNPSFQTEIYLVNVPQNVNIMRQDIQAVNSRFKKDLNLQIHVHKTIFLDDWFLDLVHKFFLN